MLLTLSIQFSSIVITLATKLTSTFSSGFMIFPSLLRAMRMVRGLESMSHKEWLRGLEMAKGRSYYSLQIPDVVRPVLLSSAK